MWRHSWRFLSLIIRENIKKQTRGLCSQFWSWIDIRIWSLLHLFAVVFLWLRLVLFIILLFSSRILSISECVELTELANLVLRYLLDFCFHSEFCLQFLERLHFKTSTAMCLLWNNIMVTVDKPETTLSTVFFGNVFNPWSPSTVSCVEHSGSQRHCSWKEMIAADFLGYVSTKNLNFCYKNNSLRYLRCFFAKKISSWHLHTICTYNLHMTTRRHTW